MTDITDRIAALGPKPDPDSWGYFAKLYARERRERDLALEVLRELASAADEVDVRHFTDSCSHSALVMRERVVAARAALAACGKGEG